MSSFANLRESYLYVFVFFTTWMFLMAVFHRATHRYTNLLLLSTVTMVVGLYLSLVNPRRFVFYFNGERHELVGLQKFFVVDVAFHILVTCFLWFRYGRYYRKKLGPDLTAIAILLLYASVSDIRKVYGIPPSEVIAVGLVAVAVYYIIAFTWRDA